MLALFDPARVQHGDRLVRGYKIVCGNCGNTDRVACNSVSGPPNDQEDARLVARKFTSSGWLIGRRVKDHRCPGCAELMIKRNREERVRKTNGVDTGPAVLHLAPALLPLVGQPAGDACPPDAAGAAQPQAAAALENARAMTRDDRRVIWAKLDDVYADEASGYKPGWSDGRVARDLNVPVAWVKLVRDENFGALPDNPVTREIVTEARDLLDTIRAHILNAQELNRAMGAIATSIADTERRVMDLEQKLAQLIDQPAP